ncbi:MAG: histidine kinase [Tannerellaceae bacterium]|nr:histidine kinase [Tannerellaceae bacterium]
MKFFESLTSTKTVLWSAMTLSLIIIYPNIGDIYWKLFSPPGSVHRLIPLTCAGGIYFIYRYFFFVALTWTLISFNLTKATQSLNKRLGYSFVIALGAYLIYVVIGTKVGYMVRMESFTKEVILQFLIAWLIPVLIGHIYSLIIVQQKVEKEMEKLRMETLQSRVEALTNQINPHFFFNSLNGIAALVSANRNQETVEYVAKLSNIFRYILQSDKKGLVTLEEELKFVDAYRYLLEVRYHGKICFEIEVPETAMELRLPVLSLLPLIENIIKHNVIDSDHKMKVHISLCGECKLFVSNPVYCKFHTETSHGIGLSNLSARYKLLMEADIEVKEEEGIFTVVLPLKKIEDESSDC